MSVDDASGIWAKLLEEVSGVLDTLLDVTVYAENVQIYQSIYQGYRAGVLDSTEYADWTGDRDDFDENDYSAEYVDQQIHFALGRAQDSSFVFIADTDNDEEFADEQLYLMPAEAPSDNWMATQQLLPAVDVQVEFYDGSEILTRTATLSINPYLKFPGRDGMLLFGGSGYQAGMLNYEGTRYAVWMADIYRLGDFGETSTRVWIEPTEERAVPERPAAQDQLREEYIAEAEVDSTKKPLPDGYYPSLREPYEIGDEITLGDAVFTLAEVSMAGNALFLERSEGSDTGLRIGSVAPNFEGLALDSTTTVSLADYRGRHVLIDFWGTWCGPCIGEIPHLRQSYANYSRDQFDILAVANDNLDSLRAFVAKEDLLWTQVPQRAGDSTRSAVLDAFRVTGYPTTFLVDPDGVIVERGSSLRGETLAKTLAKHIGE
ncbi:MAG: TlpA disulfide reductase family protein [Bacteroidota bacterium]